MGSEVDYQSQFVQEAMNIPVVTSVVGHVSNLYVSTKEYNPLLKYAIETAESVVKYGADSAKPLVSKLGKPISSVDHLAYEQLKKLENNYPIISKQPAEMIETSKHLIHDKVSSMKTYGYDKALTVKNYGTEKVVAAIDKFDGVVTITEKYFDVLIPPTGCEKKSTSDDPKNTVQRLVVLSDKAHNRLRCIAIEQLQKLKLRAEEKLDELKTVLTCMKDKTASSTKDFNGRVQNLWLELNKEESQEPKNVQETLMQKARLLTKSLTHIFKQASNVLTYVSTNAQQRFLEATDKANNLYNVFKTDYVAGQITDGVIKQALNNLQKFKETLESLSSLFFNQNKKVQDSSAEKETVELPSDGNTNKYEENNYVDGSHQT